MVTFHLRESGRIRMRVTINGYLFRINTQHKCDPKNWVNQRVVGKNSKLVNYDLDRISDEIIDWININPIHTYTAEFVRQKLNSIILDSEQTERRKDIKQYFEEFIEEKSVEINPKTNKLISRAAIRYYENAFRWFEKFGYYELELIDKGLYNRFLNYLLTENSVNHSGKIIANLKTFFTWCDAKSLPVNSEFKFWKPISEDTEEETRALNSRQLDSIYRLVIDPVDVYTIARDVFKKDLDRRQVNQVTQSVEEARRQAVAMSSIGPHKESFWALTDRNVYGNLIKYRRNKNGIECIAPFRDNDVFHAREYANLNGGPLFRRMTQINYYLKYVKELCELPFHITPKTFRKTFGSIIWNDFDHPNKMGIIMKAYGHKKESTTRKYLGIQGDDLEMDHAELFGV